ncbi:catalase B [Marasmius fiardii PR-910]|nr:catalase B [Marasmius fiardii PR-910]
MTSAASEIFQTVKPGGSSKIPGDDGFLDQFKVDDHDTITTTDFGTRVNDFRSLTAGERGPTLLEDFVLRTKITRFDHERIPERVVHARGTGVHGYFESYGNWSDLTAASFLSEKGKQTPMFVRFSTVAGSRGSPDTVRDVHGFALRFYTDEGNFDMVGNNIPVFFIQDAIQFPDLIHAVKPEPDCEMPQGATAHDTAYDFFAQNPSSLHTLLWAMAGHGIPRSFRHIDGFGVHTFRMVNDQGESKLVKFHYKSKQGRASLIWPEAQVIAGQNIDFHRQDLWESIEAGAYPEYELCVQIMNEEDVLKYGIDLFDPTKIVPEDKVPLTPLGKFVLNRNPTNFFAETEQVMFCIGHVVRGIDFTEDPLLQGRLFSYVDTQLNRGMGSPNFEFIPINRSRNEVHNNHRDGAMQPFIHSNKHAYTLNSLNNGYPKPASDRPRGNGHMHAPARRIVDARYVREISPTFLDYWTQPRLFYNSLVPAEQQMVVNGFRFELSKVNSLDVRRRFITELNRVSNDLARRVAKGINVPLPEPDSKYYHDNTAPDLSNFVEPLKTIAGLRVGILASINSSSSLEQATTLAKEFTSMGAVGLVVGEGVVDGVGATYVGSDAVLFDGIIVVDGAEGLFDPISSASSPLFPPQRPMKIVQDAFFYGKPVAAIGKGKAAFEATTPTLTDKDPGVFIANEVRKDFLEAFEGGLKKFKFTERFPMD